MSRQTKTKSKAESKQMPILLKKSKSGFVPHPEGVFDGVLVDVTPPQEFEGKYGPRELFKFVFETTHKLEDKRRAIAVSSLIPIDIHPKSNSFPIIKGILGTTPTDKELQTGINLEKFLGNVYQVQIEHVEKDDSTFANVVTVLPSKRKLKASGAYVRVCDREETFPGHRAATGRATGR